MELLDGHLHVHLDLGTGAKHVRASRAPLNDGGWHRVQLDLRRNAANITIDGGMQSFETPGEYSTSSNLSQCHVDYGLWYSQSTELMFHDNNG